MQTVARPDPAPNLPRPVGLALSGGGDSVALLARLAQDRVPARAFIVDHGLRPESAAEAEAAALLAERLGVPATVLRAGLKPGPGLQARARRARYALIATAAREAGVAHVMVAHTADDQAETVAFRLARGADVFGLAGMAARAPVPVWPEGASITVLRPLLGVKRGALRAELAALRLPFAEDNANLDPRFSRVRVRTRLGQLGAVDAFCAVAQAARPIAEAIRVSVRAAAGAIDWTDGARLPAEVWRGLGPTVRARLLAWLIACLTGGDAAPRAIKAAALAARVETGAATLAGAAARLHRGDLVVRPAPARRGAAATEPVSPDAAQARLAALCAPA